MPFSPRHLVARRVDPTSCAWHPILLCKAQPLHELFTIHNVIRQQSLASVVLPNPAGADSKVNLCSDPSSSLASSSPRDTSDGRGRGGASLVLRSSDKSEDCARWSSLIPSLLSVGESKPYWITDSL